MQLVSPKVMRVMYPVSLERDQFQALKRQQVRFQFHVEEKKTEPCFKMVAVSDINLETETDSAPYTIYEVPIDLEKLGEKHGKFSIHHIQPEVAFQIGGTEYVLTNKKGNPIRDMPNTRGRL